MTNRRVSLADFVFSQLEEDILSERYQTGQVLTELAVCEQMQVSRTPVREAFRRLQQEGYLTESGRGNLVLGTAPRDMLDVYEIRLRTEGLAPAGPPPASRMRGSKSWRIPSTYRNFIRPDKTPITSRNRTAFSTG